MLQSRYSRPSQQRRCGTHCGAAFSRRRHCWPPSCRFQRRYNSLGLRPHPATMLPVQVPVQCSSARSWGIACVRACGASGACPSAFSKLQPGPLQTA